MKKIIFFSIIFFTIYGPLQAQESKTIRVKSGNDPVRVIPMSDKYRFARFTDGKIYYVNSVSAGKLNYSILLGEIHFIGPKQDTLSLANEQLIKKVSIGESNFYYAKEKGYVEEIADFNNIKLGISQIIHMVNSEKEGAYDQSTGVASIRSYKSLATGNSSLQRLQLKGDILLAKRVNYFLIDQNSRIHIASKANFLKVYAKHKKMIATYIKQEMIDFKSEKDLRKLLSFCNQLS
ncbi:hypothetical protein GXP67_04975 [Rhodocytophaga rosea]|uniref:Uncharacterized protein n=1 Tax=Rhodocytophaga rosea TaxID=2704465 RepID=A0A6C0GE12_9BACT|nr:hypothetical protein [Rhodocytophaga rosea]QHT66064.1 hypothetical protein GXP67_04975 [Rhodocytophaga rosea]